MNFAALNETPLVSVCLLTYKHEDYIVKAIESVLEQQTDFPCEFIIAEDCSPDATREIVKSYAKKYPIKLILQEKNVGMQRNLKDLLDAPIGKYVAFFEGDDYWIDSLKLKKQVAIFEEREDVAVCYANAKIYDTKNPNSNIWFKNGVKPPQFTNRYDVIAAFTMPTCTFMFRNTLKPFPEWGLRASSQDYFMAALACKHGGAYYIDECLGLYTHHYAGLSRTIAEDKWLVNDFYAWQNLYAYYDHDPKAYESVVVKSLCNIDALFYKNFPTQARDIFRQLEFTKVLRKKKFRWQVIKMGIKLHLPFFRMVRTSLKK